MACDSCDAPCNKRDTYAQVLGSVFAKYSLPHAFTGPPAMFGIHLGKQVCAHENFHRMFLFLNEFIAGGSGHVQGLEEDHERAVRHALPSLSFCNTLPGTTCGRGD